MRRTTSLFLGVAVLATTCGCANLKGTLSWTTKPCIRVPAGLPRGYDDHLNPTVQAEGWNFRHLVACSTRQSPEAHWWMAWPQDGTKLKLGNASWFKMLFTGTAIRRSDWKKIAAITPELAEASRRGLGAYPQMIAPELTFRASAAETENEKSLEAVKESSAPPERVLRLGELPGKGSGLGWAKGPSDQPPFDPLWSSGDDYSQLGAAKQRLRAATNSAGGGIRVGILDMGYNSKHIMVPRNTLGSNGQPGGDRRGERLGDSINTLACADGACGLLCPGDTNGPHGLKAMSVFGAPSLALVDDHPGQPASKVRPDRLSPNKIEVGGAPDAVVIPVRVAPWIFSHSTANLAYSIDYASRVQRADVLSISHGGTPSPLWIDAVNAAYDRGTSMFAACGDYYNLPPINVGIISPSASVYPAACRRVQSVAGVTANGEPYGKADFKHYWSHYLLPWNWLLMRGSFGADGAHRDPFHTSMAAMNKRTDPPQVNAGGLLRAQPISTWSPNVPSAQPPSKKNGYETDLVNLDWDGTSAAAPQSAAAAALYIAMHKSAGPTKPGAAQVPLSQRQPDPYCGSGTLKAANMLDVSFQDARNTNEKGVRMYPKSKNGMHRDWYDGQRSGAAILGWQSSFATYSKRADALTDANHIVRDPNQKKDALKIIFYNQELVQRWNIGHLPQKASSPKNWFARLFSPDAPDLEERAEAQAEAAMKAHP